LTTWFLLLSAYAFTNVSITSMAPPALPEKASASLAPALTPAQLGPGYLAAGLLAGISQVFLAHNLVTGAIFLIALAISSRAAAACAVVGSAVALGVAIAFGATPDGEFAGLYGFSAVLTSVAVGSVFYALSFRVALYVLFGIAFTVIVQAALNVLLQPMGIPTLTAPFVFVTWLLLLPRARFMPVMHEYIQDGAAAPSAMRTQVSDEY
jgi:urea transporter